MQHSAFESVLQHPTIASDIEVLSAISARAWELLQQPEFARLFLQALANERVGQQGFDQLLQDLLFIPAIHDPLMKALTQCEQNSATAKRFEQFKKNSGLT
jgi:hypothetical protein